MDVLFVHGYSESSLGAYFDLPTRLRDALPGVDRVVLAAFDSLDDTITIDDLADAMETRVHALETAGQFTTAGSAMLCHSTGALITRRWILNRLESGQQIPSHLVTLGGANHGSTLAQMGKSVLGYVQKLLFKHVLTVGANVLTDLDYGSDFLLRLNSEWMQRWNDGSLDALYAFSLGGDSVGGDPSLQAFWQTHEAGSDNTVRISGANLNYTLIEIDRTPAGPTAIAITPRRHVPHLILAGYSHFGGHSGIIGWIDPTEDRVLKALTAALGVNGDAAYGALAQQWEANVGDWITAQRTSRAANGANGHSVVNATGVFTIRDASGRPIEDCIIAILNQQQLGEASNILNPDDVDRLVAATNAVSSAIMPHSPIHNNVQRGSYSFYIDFDQYVATSPHWFHVAAALPAGLVDYLPLTFSTPASLEHAVKPNEFTYLSLTMRRGADDAYAMYDFGPELNLPGTTWMPFPPPGRLA